jgi:GNAT superfamily N-acetyltransferase
MMDKNQFQPAYLDDCRGLSLKKMDAGEVALYLFLYGCVGERWRWRDRLLLTQRQLEALPVAPGNSIYVLYVDNVAAGCIELTKSDKSTKIVYFGLCPDYIGKDLGKHLLSYGIEQAWNDNAKRL